MNDHAFAGYARNAIAQGGRNIGPPPPQSPDQVMPVAGAFFAAIVCPLGILALTAGLERVWHGFASQSWPTVSGVTHLNNPRNFAQAGSGAHVKVSYFPTGPDVAVLEPGQIVPALAKPIGG